MKHRKLLAILIFIAGVLLLVIPAYLFITSNKTVFTSDKTSINEPETAITRTVLLEEKNNPYQITMTVNFDIKNNPKQSENHLLSYIASLANSKGETIEQKSSNYTYLGNDTGGKSETITLFIQKSLPTDTYAISIVIQPDKTKDSAIKLNSFSYQIKSNILGVHPAFPVAGLLLLPIAYLILPKKPKQPVTP